MAAHHDSPHPHRDAVLQAEIWLALWQAADSGDLDIDRLVIAVHEGEVRLEGQVKNARQMHLAECLVDGIVEAGCCHCQLVINHRAWQPD
jgi:osmotically-inducible protein OsmY